CTPGLDDTVAGLAAGRGGDEAQRLAEYAIRYVLLTRPVDQNLARTLDSVPGLIRVSAPDGAALWKVTFPSARVRVINPDGKIQFAVPSEPVDTVAQLPPGPAGRRLVLAESADHRWTATLDGRKLPKEVVHGWAQGFRLPAEGGRLEIRYDSTMREMSLVLQLVLLLAVIVLALPDGRRAEDEEEETETPPGGVEVPPATAHPEAGVEPDRPILP
ncbi:hypothetical protein TR74_00520, partial [Carbonactinospora thermoautotrophica]